jgi:hypothetical protein
MVKTFNEWLKDRQQIEEGVGSDILGKIKRYAKIGLKMGGGIAHLAGGVLEVLGPLAGAGGALAGIGMYAPNMPPQLALGGTVLAGGAGLALSQIPAQGLHAIGNFLREYGKLSHDKEVEKIYGIIHALTKDAPSDAFGNMVGNSMNAGPRIPNDPFG